MPAALIRRLAALEDAHAAKLPMLPALVVIGENNLEANRAEFIATHSRPPELTFVIKRACARLAPS
jgi:hypothetical protein